MLNNKVKLSGRIVAGPELGMTRQGQAFFRFIIRSRRKPRKEGQPKVVDQFVIRLPDTLYRTVPLGINDHVSVKGSLLAVPHFHRTYVDKLTHIVDIYKASFGELPVLRPGRRGRLQWGKLVEAELIEHPAKFASDRYYVGTNGKVYVQWRRIRYEVAVKEIEIISPPKFDDRTVVLSGRVGRRPAPRKEKRLFKFALLAGDSIYHCACLATERAALLKPGVQLEIVGNINTRPKVNPRKGTQPWATEIFLRKFQVYS